MPVSSPIDRSALELEPLRDSFLTCELEGRRFKDAWISTIAQRDERAVLYVGAALRCF